MMGECEGNSRSRSSRKYRPWAMLSSAMSIDISLLCYDRASFDAASHQLLYAVVPHVFIRAFVHEVGVLVAVEAQPERRVADLQSVWRIFSSQVNRLCSAEQYRWFVWPRPKPQHSICDRLQIGSTPRIDAGRHHEEGPVLVGPGYSKLETTTPSLILS